MGDGRCTLGCVTGVLALLVVCLALLAAAPAQATIYWAELDGSNVARANNDGSSVDHDWLGFDDATVTVMVTNRNIFWGNQAGEFIKIFPLANPTSGPAVPTKDPYQLATDGSYIYWTSNVGGNAISRWNRVEN